MSAPRFAAWSELEAWLAGTQDRERHPERLRANDLGRMQALVARLGHPQRDVISAHVAGTKGKGTTCAALASILDATGLKVGLHTSPHLVDLRERIRLGARPAPDALWLDAARDVAAACRELDEAPTWFERVTALSFLIFRRAGVQVAVHEVGLGGRFDATNVLEPAVTVITRIGLDHVELLGTTPGLIAAEKAGIVKRGVPLVAGPHEPEASQVILARAAELGAPVWLLGREVTVEAAPSDGGVDLRITTPRGAQRVWAPHAGGPGAANLGLAVGAAELLANGLGRDPTAVIGPALGRLRWRGRFDLIPGVPEVLVDGAHEAASFQALADVWRLRRGSAQAVLLVGVLSDKPLPELVRALTPMAREVVACRVDSPRARDPEELAAAFRAAGVTASAVGPALDGLAHARGRAEALRTSVVATGSLYLAGTVLAALGQDTLPAWEE